MSRVDVIARYRRAAQIARGWGVDVVFVSGWTTRGRDTLRPQYIVEHCTSDPSPLSTANMERILSNGHGVISGNSICTDWITRSAQVRVIASGISWHAGNSSWRNSPQLNPISLGTEIQRAASQSITASQLRAAHLWTKARSIAFGIPVINVCTHSECGLPRGRKVDPRLTPTRSLSGTAWRHDLTNFVDPTRPPTPRTITLGDTGNDVLAWNRTLTELFPYHPASEVSQTNRFTAGTAARTMLVLRYAGLSASDPSRPRVGPITRSSADRMRREPWSGKRVLVKTGGLRYSRSPGWHPENAVAGQHPAGRLFGGAIVNKLTVGAGEQYEVWPRRSDPYLYITTSPAHVELV